MFAGSVAGCAFAIKMTTMGCAMYICRSRSLSVSPTQKAHIPAWPSVVTRKKTTQHFLDIIENYKYCAIVDIVLANCTNFNTGTLYYFLYTSFIDFRQRMLNHLSSYIIKLHYHLNGCFSISFVFFLSETDLHHDDLHVTWRHDDKIPSVKPCFLKELPQNIPRIGCCDNKL